MIDDWFSVVQKKKGYNHDHIIYIISLYFCFLCSPMNNDGVAIVQKIECPNYIQDPSVDSIPLQTLVLFLQVTQ